MKRTVSNKYLSFIFAITASAFVGFLFGAKDHVDNSKKNQIKTTPVETESTYEVDINGSRIDIRFDGHQLILECSGSGDKDQKISISSRYGLPSYYRISNSKGRQFLLIETLDGGTGEQFKRWNIYTFNVGSIVSCYEFIVSRHVTQEEDGIFISSEEKTLCYFDGDSIVTDAHGTITIR